jgi:hypothetical protein
MRGPARRLNRATPALPAEHMQTYRIVRPAQTHWRPASCAEVDCLAYRHGWRSVIDERTELGQSQAHYIRRESGRGFTEVRDSTGCTVFTFEAGQRCFNATNHQVEVGHDPLYVVRGGDWRGNPRGTVRRHSGPDPWLDDFATNQDRIANVVDRG